MERYKDLAKAWLWDAAWPLWSGAGLDPRGGFRERLSLAMMGIEDSFTRVRVQARQTYCYAVAAQMGWDGGNELTRLGADYIIEHCFLANGLVGAKIHHGRGLTSEGTDLYDIGFAIFALSQAGAALDENHYRQAALKLWLSTKTELEDRVGGGYSEKLPKPILRAQNPHMHLFEALLSLYCSTQDTRILQDAKALQGFVVSSFINADSGGLRELAGRTTSTSDDRYEAGHQYEWYWLMHRHAALTQDPVIRVAPNLLDFGRRLTPENMRVPLSHNLDLSVREEYARSWVLTEALKANLASAKAGDSQGVALAVDCFEALLRDHLLDQGGWIDRVDLDGSPLSSDMPASTFYHVVCAFNELINFDAD